MNEWLRPGERIDDLMRGRMRIIQNPAMFRFGTDAVLLADFAKAQNGERICDLGAGVGILPLLIAARAPGAAIDAVEIQAALCDIARRNVAMNGLGETVAVYQQDIKTAAGTLGEKKYDCVVCNPPYFKGDAGILSLRDEVRIARHEVLCTLEDIFAAAARLLRHGGRLCMIHLAARAFEVADGLRAHGMEPKTVRAVHYQADRPAKLVLWEARRGGSGGLVWMPPLIMCNGDGRETDELREIYGEGPP